MGSAMNDGPVDRQNRTPTKPAGEKQARAFLTWFALGALIAALFGGTVLLRNRLVHVFLRWLPPFFGQPEIGGRTYSIYRAGAAYLRLTNRGRIGKIGTEQPFTGIRLFRKTQKGRVTAWQAMICGI